MPTGPSAECGIDDEPPLILTGGSDDWTVDSATDRPVLTLNADYRPEAPLPARHDGGWVRGRLTPGGGWGRWDRPPGGPLTPVGRDRPPVGGSPPVGGGVGGAVRVWAGWPRWGWASPTR
ncbi:hypothetical protein GCM10023237_63760 [Streptomyces coeruleoprunus]